MRETFNTIVRAFLNRPIRISLHRMDYAGRVTEIYFMTFKDVDSVMLVRYERFSDGTDRIICFTSKYDVTEVDSFGGVMRALYRHLDGEKPAEVFVPDFRNLGLMD